MKARTNGSQMYIWWWGPSMVESLNSNNILDFDLNLISLNNLLFCCFS